MVPVDQLLERQRVDLAEPLAQMMLWRASASAAPMWPAASSVRIRRSLVVGAEVVDRDLLAPGVAW